MMNRERRYDRVVLIVDPPGAVVAHLELKTFAAELETLARPIEHLIGDINHRDARARKAVRDKRREQTGAGAEIEHLYLAIARKSEQIDRRAIEIVEAGHQTASRAVVVLRRQIEGALYQIFHLKIVRMRTA